MRFGDAFLDELRGRLQLSSLIGRNVRLVKRGREYSGLCPFHNEKSPSFTVNDDKGFFHCFGCGAHGDAIGYAMRSRGLTFPEAVKDLAAEAGLQLPPEDPQLAKAEMRRQAQRGLIADLQSWAAAQLDGGLDPDYAAHCRHVLEGFGIGVDAARRLGLGVIPQSRPAMQEAMAARGHDAARLGDNLQPGILFPLQNRRGEAVGAAILFDGRDPQGWAVVGEDSGLFNQASALAHAGSRPLTIHGTPLGAARAAAQGIDAVAGLSSPDALEKALQGLWRAADEPVLVAFDRIQARRMAALALPLLKPGHSVRLAVGTDQPQSLSDFIWTEIVGAGLATMPERDAARAKVEATLGRIADPDVRRQYQAEYRRRLDSHGVAVPRARKGPVLPSPSPDAHEFALLGVLLRHPGLLHDQAILDSLARLRLRATVAEEARRELLKLLSAGLAPVAIPERMRAGPCVGAAVRALGLVPEPEIEADSGSETASQAGQDLWRQSLARVRLDALREQLAQAERRLAEKASQEAFDELTNLKAEIVLVTAEANEVPA